MEMGQAEEGLACLNRCRARCPGSASEAMFKETEVYLKLIFALFIRRLRYLKIVFALFKETCGTEPEVHTEQHFRMGKSMNHKTEQLGS